MSGEFQGYYDRGMKSDDRDEAYEEVMTMTEAELVAELAEQGETLESNAVKMQAIFHRAKAEAEMRLVIKAWLKCPAEKRPSPAALGQRIADIATDLTRKA
jgi:plasmid stability protein